MSAKDKKACKRFHFGKGTKYLMVFVGLLAITYGGLFRVRTNVWPWDNWTAFVSFTSVTTRDAIQRGREFTREKVVPATKDLLARAQDLLKEWDEEDPAVEDGSGDSNAGSEDEAL